MKCKLTHTEGKGINAHIIPKSFYAIDPSETQPTKIITNVEGKYPQRSPIGIYDNNIVTAEGERVFSDWDDYASDLLLKQKMSFQPINHYEKIVALQIAEYDYTKLKLFFLSVLWRASVSSQPFFHRIDLGPHEEQIRQALLNGDPKDSDWFAVSIAMWSDHSTWAGMMDPFRTKFDGINYYVFYLEHYIVYYKVDQRISSGLSQSIQLRPNSPLVVIGRELHASKERKIIEKMVNMYKQKANN